MNPNPLVPARGPRHAALLLAGWLACGVVAGEVLDLSPAVWAATAAAVLAATIALIRGRSLSARILQTVAASLLLLSLGGWRSAVETVNRPHPELTALERDGKPVEIIGRLASIPRLKTYGWRAPLDILGYRKGIETGSLRARVLLSSRRSLATLRYGDIIRLKVRLKSPAVRRNPGGFDYADYLFRQGIDAVARPVGEIVRLSGAGSRWSLHNLVEPIRGWMRSVFGQYLPRTPRALILGFLLGDTDQLPKEVFTAFRETGTLHLLAVSGANVWLIVGMALFPLKLLRTTRWTRTLVLLGVIVLFSFLTRNEPSVVRASLMAGSILIGRLIFRPPDALNAVGIAGALILIVSPFQVFRAGFQLSFAAVIAILLVGKRTLPHRGVTARRWVRWAITVSISSVAATVATAPIVAWHYGTVAAMSLPANLVMVPLAGLAVYFGVAFLVIGTIMPSLAVWFAVPTAWILDACAWTAEFFTRIPGAVWTWPQPSVWAVINFYLAGTLLLNWRHRYRWLRPLTYYALAGLIVVVVRQTFAHEPPHLKLAVLDAGTARVVAVSHPNGATVWIADSLARGKDLRQWVLEPFSGTFLGRKTWDTRSFVAWRDGTGPVASRPAGNAGPSVNPQWESLVSLGGNGRITTVRADRFTWAGDTVFLVRNAVLRGGEAPLDSVIATTGQLLILPANSPAAWLRKALARWSPPGVLFYGHGWSRHPDDWLSAWRAHFPRTRFWSTRVHGGVIISWTQNGLKIVPTIVNNRWQDPDLR